MAQFLTRLPDLIPADQLFQHIAAIHMTSRNRKWAQVGRFSRYCAWKHWLRSSLHLCFENLFLSLLLPPLRSYRHWRSRRDRERGCLVPKRWAEIRTKPAHAKVLNQTPSSLWKSLHSCPSWRTWERSSVRLGTGSVEAAVIKLFSRGVPLLRLEPEHWWGSQWLSRAVKKEYEALFNFQHPSSAQRPSSKLETCSWERLKNVTHTPTYMNLPDWLSSPQTKGNHRDTRYYIKSFTAVSSQILSIWFGKWNLNVSTAMSISVVKSVNDI